MAIAGLYDIFNERWASQGTVWLYSDPHFDDPDLKAGIERPSADEMVKMINSKVGKKDTFLCLGDCGNLDYIRKIRGYKVLIAGNHDTGLSVYKRQKVIKIFPKDDWDKDAAMSEMKKLYPNCVYSIDEEYDFHAPFQYWVVEADNRLFDEVYSGALFIGEKLILSHEPVDFPFALNLHGHNHSPLHRDDKTHININCDGQQDYYPVNLNQLMKSGPTAHIQSIHRDTIDKATKRKKKRGGRKIGER